VSGASALETRGLHALTREEAINCFPVNPKDAADAHGIEPAVVNQAPDRLRMHAELVRDFTHADETAWFWAYGRHNPL
jgi:hypothetical protein